MHMYMYVARIRPSPIAAHGHPVLEVLTDLPVVVGLPVVVVGDAPAGCPVAVEPCYHLHDCCYYDHYDYDDDYHYYYHYC